MRAQRGPQDGHWALSQVGFTPLTVERVTPDRAGSSPKMPSFRNGLRKPTAKVMTENVGVREIPTRGTEGAPGPHHLDLHPACTHRAAVHQPEPCVLWEQKRRVCALAFEGTLCPFPSALLQCDKTTTFIHFSHPAPPHPLLPCSQHNPMFNPILSPHLCR